MNSRLRIGTWNLAARWDARHHDLLLSQKCDVWLLTEISAKVRLDGFDGHLTSSLMGRKQHWAGVFSRKPMQQLADPHMASAAVCLGGMTYCSTILPWRGCGPEWGTGRHAEKTDAAVEVLLTQLRPGEVVWGGDWNHALVGKETAGSMGGRNAIKGALSQLRLNVPTTDLPHRLGGATIDHIAVPDTWMVEAARCVSAICDSKRLSDHDIYVVDVVSAEARS